MSTNNLTQNIGYGRICYTVPEGPGRTHNGTRYAPGCKLFVPKCLLAEWLPEKKATVYPDGCFPERKCNADGSWDYTQAYVNQYLLAADTPTDIVIPDIAGCARPKSLEITACGGGCIFWNINATAAVPAGDIVDGTAMSTNPSVIALCGSEEAEAITTISIVSPVDLVVNAYFWGNCC